MTALIMCQSGLYTFIHVYANICTSVTKENYCRWPFYTCMTYWIKNWSYKTALHDCFFLYLIEETMKKILVIGFVFALSVSSMNNFNISFSGYFKIIICYIVHALNSNLKGNNSKFIYKNIKVKKIYNFKISMFKCIQTF